jgi:cell division protein FtsB
LNKKLLLILLLLFAVKAYSQPVDSFKEIKAVDSIAQTKSTASIFAALYIKTMLEIEEQLKQMDTVTIRQIRKLEINFAEYFLKACREFYNSSKTGETWNAYFTITNLSTVQLKLLGINAHINGDLWQALKDSFSETEIKGISKTVFLFHQSLLYIYKEVYREAVAENRKIKTLHILSLGLSQKYGKHLLSKWRKRQLKLASLYYFNQERFDTKKSRTEKKKIRIDNMITRRL